jgi:hypothetical protein
MRSSCEPILSIDEYTIFSEEVSEKKKKKEEKIIKELL